MSPKKCDKLQVTTKCMYPIGCIVMVQYNTAVSITQTWCKNNVTCRPIARQRTRRKQLYQSRYSVTDSQTSMFARKQLETTTEERCFLCDPCRDVLRRTVCENQLRVDSWRNELVVRQSPTGKKVSTEAGDILGIRYQETTGEKQQAEKTECVL
jgi:hypothetical protein